MRIFLSSLVVSLVLSGCFGSPVTPVPTAPSDATAPTAVTKEAEKVTDVAPAPTAPTVKNQDAKKPSTQPVKGSSQSAPTTPKPQTSQETTSGGPSTDEMTAEIDALVDEIVKGL